MKQRDLSSQRFYHGTKANLKQGDLIEPGFNSNYGKRKKASYIYLTATLDTTGISPSPDVCCHYGSRLILHLSQKFNTNLCTRTKSMNPKAWDYNKEEINDNPLFLENKKKNGS